MAEPDLPQKEASEVAKGKVSMDRLALGKRLEELRGEFGFVLDAVAAFLGVDVSLVAKLGSGWAPWICWRSWGICTAAI